MTSPLLLSFFISWNFNRKRNREKIASLISIISMTSIALGVAVLIIGLSAINGFEHELNHRILSIIPHGEVEPINQPWKNWLQKFQKIEQVEGISAAAPYIKFTGLIENGINLCILQIKGINPWQEEKVSILSQFIQEDDWVNFRSGAQQIIIGRGVANELQVKKGDWVSIMIPEIGNGDNIHQSQQIFLQIIGILNLNSQFDHSIALIPLEDARIYLNMDNSITGISIKTNNAFIANELIQNAGKVVDDYVYIKSWIDTYGYIYRDIQMIRTVIYLAIVLVLSVSCFNITSTLMIAVKNKNNDIAILRTLGAKNSLIRAIFIWYGLSYGFIGSLFGIIIGVAVSMWLTSIACSIEKLTGYHFLSSDIYFIDFLPSELHIKDVIYILIMVFLLSLLASWYPACRASHINPAKILNNQ